MTDDIETTLAHGDTLQVPLNKLKKSPRNARRTAHTAAAVEALAASIGAKGVLQALVVEPERDEAGVPTGFYLVTIGEGRRQALLLRARQKAIKKTEPITVVVDLANDAHEISLDENVTRFDMHPADQFEAFQRLAQERGLGAEEIGARFGVSAQVVRQRLRLGAVSPRLMERYRDEELTLDQLMAFAVSDDVERQEQVYDQLGWNRSAHMIRRAMTETKAPLHDRRAVFVGAEAYTAAGGAILRDLFTEDGGGWCEDVGLLDRLASEKLAALAVEVRDTEGWKWAEAQLDFPHGHGFGRAYPRPVERSEADRAALDALSCEYDGLIEEWQDVEEPPPEVEARLREIDLALAHCGDGYAYLAEDIARAGVFVVLGHDGLARIERGLVRPQDLPAPPQTVEPDTEAGPTADRFGGGGEDAEEPEETDAPYPDRLVMDLTAHRTLALRDALACDPALALATVVHSLALAAFYPAFDRPTCLEIRASSAPMAQHAEGADDSPAGRAVADRHARWAMRLPQAGAEAWAVVTALTVPEQMDLLAHCAALTINAVRTPWDRRPAAWGHADALAGALALDMTRYWAPTAANFFGRVAKAKIAQAVREAVSVEAAERLVGLKKPQMAEAAEEAVAGTGWLPPPLRKPAAAADAEPGPEPVAPALATAA